MRTNIDLDDRLLEAAFRCAPVKSKKDLVHLVLREFIEHHQRKDLRELRGRVGIRPDYDHKALREYKDDTRYWSIRRSGSIFCVTATRLEPGP